MRMYGNPFTKYSYGDEKTDRNMLEVAAIIVAAERLNIPAVIVDACSHNYYVDVDCRCLPSEHTYDGRKNCYPWHPSCDRRRKWVKLLLAEARKLPESTAEVAVDEIF